MAAETGSKGIKVTDRFAGKAPANGRTHAIDVVTSEKDVNGKDRKHPLHGLLTPLQLSENGNRAKTGDGLPADAMHVSDILHSDGPSGIYSLFDATPKKGKKHIEVDGHKITAVGGIVKSVVLSRGEVAEDAEGDAPEKGSLMLYLGDAVVRDVENGNGPAVEFIRPPVVRETDEVGKSVSVTIVRFAHGKISVDTIGSHYPILDEDDEVAAAIAQKLPVRKELNLDSGADAIRLGSIPRDPQPIFIGDKKTAFTILDPGFDKINKETAERLLTPLVDEAKAERRALEPIMREYAKAAIGKVRTVSDVK